MRYYLRAGVVSVYVILLACAFNSGCSPSAPPASKQSFSAEIVSTDGAKTLVNSLVCTRNHESSADVTQAARLNGRPVAETVTKHRSIHVQMGPVILELPFEIIKSIVQKRENQYAHVPFAHATIILGDGSVIKGLTFEDFQGQTDLGDFSMPIDSVASVSFTHQPQAAQAFAPRGTHSMVVHRTDGSQVALTGATFVKDVYGKDGLWDRDAPIGTFGFSTEDDAKYSVEWINVAAIVREYVSNSKMQGDRWVLTLRSGQTQAGFVGDNERIEGAASFVGGYKLRATVPLQPRREFVLEVKEEPAAYAKLELRD
jgi:hypothetical protein